MKKTVLIPLDIEKEGKTYLREKGYELIIPDTINRKSLLKQVENCDAILTRSNVTIDQAMIAAGEKLQVISKYGVGLNNIDVDFATSQGIYVTSTPEANANVVAEHVMAFILMLAKRLSVMDRELRKGNFDIRNQIYSEDLERKTLGVIGLGRIGKLVARKAYDGFNMNIVGYDPFVTSDNSWITNAEFLEDLLREADVISLHLPFTSKTKHMISTEEFSMMKSSAFFINTSRGGTVDETALVKALQTQQIAGAALDVFETEPPDITDELFSLDNIIVTPHSAALSKEGAVKMAVHAAMQIDQVLTGRQPTWPVNQVDHPATK